MDGACVNIYAYDLNELFRENETIANERKTYVSNVNLSRQFVSICI